MSKLKSHSGAKKRVERTGRGRFVIRRNSRNHLLLQKQRRQKRLHRLLPVSRSDAGALRHLIPYS